ncbi:MAG: helix-turn-helix transcriptional regulator [Acidobacteria bacterium]|nr:helix-turn-helix transcriptional regulator [Acidobacteriota bacterium]
MASRKTKTAAQAETFGERLRRLRQERGLTQAEIAVHAGISRRAFIYYEAEGGTPSPDLLAKLADALGVSTDLLAGRSSATPLSALPNHRLLRRLKKLEELPAHDQKAVLRMIDMMVEARRRAV